MKHIRPCSIIYWFVLILLGCSGGYDRSLKLFVPSNNVKYLDLLRDDFIIVTDSDIPMLYKNNVDTSVLFTFDFGKTNVLTKQWIINIPKVDSAAFDLIFAEFIDSNQLKIHNNQLGHYQCNYFYNYRFNQLYEIVPDSIQGRIIITYFQFNDENLE